MSNPPCCCLDFRVSAILLDKSTIFARRNPSSLMVKAHFLVIKPNFVAEFPHIFWVKSPLQRCKVSRSPNGWWFHPPLIPAFLHLVGGITTSHDGGDAQLARNDGGVAGTATAVGDDGTSLLPWQVFFLNSECYFVCTWEVNISQPKTAHWFIDPDGINFKDLLKFRLKTWWIVLERHGMPPSDMMGSQSGSVMSATSTWPCSNSPIWSMLVKMFTCRSLKMVRYIVIYTVIVLLCHWNSDDNISNTVINVPLKHWNTIDDNININIISPV